MTWYQLASAQDPQLDELATQYNLHPLHIEDCRSEGERVKVDIASHYTFALLKTIVLPADDEMQVFPLCIFAGQDPAGQDFAITIADPVRPVVAAAMKRVHDEQPPAAPSRILYLIFDTIVDSYFPTLDALDDRIDILEDVVVSPASDTLERIFAVKRQLVDMRRLLVNTRDAAMHLQRDGIVSGDLDRQLTLRDLYDHVARLLDSVETHRDLLNDTLDIYLSSIANRTNEVMKVLTVMSTVALPALVVTGIYGMNVHGLPFQDAEHGATYVASFTVLLTAGLLVLLRWLEWF